MSANTLPETLQALPHAEQGFYHTADGQWQLRWEAPEGFGVSYGGASLAAEDLALQLSQWAAPDTRRGLGKLLSEAPLLQLHVELRVREGTHRGARLAVWAPLPLGIDGSGLAPLRGQGEERPLAEVLGWVQAALRHEVSLVRVEIEALQRAREPRTRYDKADMYAVWAPDTSPWSLWAKPVLFEALSRIFTVDAPTDDTTDFSKIERALRHEGDGELPSDCALIIDWRGDVAVWLGVALARWGWQPVPLYNGVPGSSSGGQPMVDAREIADALRAATPLLDRIVIPPGAPPAFLIDAARNAQGARPQPKRFDNRWFVLAQDMPSADRLRLAGIRNVMLISDRMVNDVQHILYAYQEGGLLVTLLRAQDEVAQALHVKKPQRFGSIFYRLGVIAGLRRNAAGGFGAVVPEPSQSSGS